MTVFHKAQIMSRTCLPSILKEITTWLRNVDVSITTTGVRKASVSIQTCAGVQRLRGAAVSVPRMQVRGACRCVTLSVPYETRLAGDRIKSCILSAKALFDQPAVLTLSIQARINSTPFLFYVRNIDRCSVYEGGKVIEVVVNAKFTERSRFF